MGSYKSLSKKFLIKKAIEFGYDEDNILVLENREEDLKRLFPQTYRNIVDCAGHKADGRSAFEFAQDIVASWVIEDYIRTSISKESDLVIVSNGVDQDRKILPNKRVNGTSDFEVMLKGMPETKTKVELVCNYDNYWERNKKCDLRDFKYQKLQKEKALMLGIMFKGQSKFILVDFANPPEAEYVEHHIHYGNKGVYSMSLQDEEFLVSKIQRFVDKIKEKVYSRVITDSIKNLDLKSLTSELKLPNLKSKYLSREKEEPKLQKGLLFCFTLLVNML